MAFAWRVLRRDPFYARFGLRERIARPTRAGIVPLLRLGVPMGLSMVVEVTGFTCMAFLIARSGATAVAGHQIAVNLVSLMYMLPLAIANASGTLVAQRIGAGDAAGAQRLGWHGIAIGAAAGGAFGLAAYLGRDAITHAYTDNPVILAAALPLLTWVALFHFADATQAVTAFVLRAYRIVTVPLVVNTVALWGVGIGGGYLLAFDRSGRVPAELLGAPGFWAAATLALVVAASALLGAAAADLSAARAPARRSRCRLEAGVDRHDKPESGLEHEARLDRHIRRDGLQVGKQRRVGLHHVEDVLGLDVLVHVEHGLDHAQPLQRVLRLP